MNDSRFVCTLLALVLAVLHCRAADAPERAPAAVISTAPKPEAPLVFAGANARTRAAWQRHLTLGPNDVVSFQFYGRPELARPGVLIGPDGRVSYLQAQGIMAAGLTIDELRDAITAELGKHYRKPSVIVTPGEFRSKKFHVLGKVVNKGTYTLERPLTLIEAVALAGGLETGLFELNTVELADLPRSFLIRNGQRVPVDFDKLFRAGDLSQNLLLEPEDYLYFPSAVANEIYVLGAVRTPGAKGMTEKGTVTSAISVAGGFAERAYKGKVLVVRGSLDAPRRFVVNVSDILAGKVADFRIEPRDIVYVANHPWSRVEDLADMAATAFITTMVTVWTGSSVNLINQSVIPTLK